MKNPIKNGKEVFAVLSVATIMSLSMSVKTDAASESKIDLAAESAYTQTIINDIRTRRYAALAEASQELKATDFIGLGNELELGDEIIPAALRAPEKSTDPNYLKDEKNVGFYKDTQLERGNGPYTGYNPTTEMDRFIDGFRYNTLEPSATSESLTKYGFELEFDKEKGQRTYTSFGFTNSGRLTTVLNPVTITAKSPEEGSLGDGFKTPNYKANTVLEITPAGRQMNLNALNTIEDLEHINNKDIINTTMVWEGNYTKDNPNGLRATQGNSALYSFTVNPWPNENDMLDLIYLNGDYDKKEFVQGQEINTGIKVENLDENARKRLVGQVYHPVSGDVVPGAEAYIDENDMVVVKMPEGALKQDANGKTVINEDSIFSKAGYKNIQSLDVKFFARPRTKAEFEAIAGENYGTYTETGAGTEVINHKGQSVTIDKQGIPRYDHYNKVGEFKINLDDTMYYDQRFEDGNNDDTTKVTSSAVKPEKPFDVKIVPPANPGETDKSAADMNGAESRGEAAGELILDFIEKENKGKAPEDQWKIDVDKHDISKFTITPPASAKSGDFVAVAIKYTYTNGSTDTHWFHFVVQESTYIKPEYETQVNYPTRQQTSPATVKDDDKRIKPDHYTLPDTLEIDGEGNKFITDDLGNKWTVSIDGKTGQVTAQPVDPDKFNGGEKLTVPVIAHYKDPQKPGEDITENVDAYFVIKEKANMTVRYNAKAGKSGDELSSDVILNEEDTYNRRPTKFTLDSDTFVDDKGNTWNVTIEEDTGRVTATVPNAEEGQSIDGALLNVPVIAHYFEIEDGQEVPMGTRQTEVQFVASGTDGTYVKKEDIPFETKVEKDPELKKGEIKVITEGEKGSKKVTYTIKDSKITDTKEEELKAPQDRLIHVGEGTEDGEHKIEEKVEVPYEVEIQFDDTLKPGEQVVFQEGEPGEKTRTTTITIQDGNVTKTEVGEYTETKAPKKKIIKVGANTEGKVEHKEEIPFKYTVEFDPKFHENYPDATDNYKVVTEGVAGEKTTTWTIKNSQIVEGPVSKQTKDPVDAVIKVGKKDYNGTFTTKETKAVEFDTEYRVNNELKPGEVKEIQKGELGEEETTVTHTIVNGEVTKSEEGTPKIIKQPVKRIVEVGPGSIEGETTKEFERKIPYETKVIYDDTLEAGFQQIENEGKAGKEKVTITTKIVDGKLVTTESTEKIEDKEDRVVRVGVKPVVKKTELGHDTEYRYNPKLKEGEEKVIEEGSNGKVEYTISFNKEKGKIEVSEKRIEPKNKIVEIGYKTDGELKFESEQAYNVIIKENPDLEAGKHNVVQEGVVGKTETTVKIENSKEVSRDTKTIREKQDMIIEIGTKNVCEIPPVDPDPDKPTDPKDPTKPGDKDPEKPEKPDGEDPKDPEESEKPGYEDHEKPDKPDKPNRPSYPDDNWPWTPREDDPKNPPLVSHEKPKFEIEVKKDDKDPEIKEDEEVKVSENEELKETEENKALEEDQKDQIEETEEENNVIDNDDEREVTKKGRAPKTNDPGIALETASAGLASALLLLLRRFKRRK